MKVLSLLQPWASLTMIRLPSGRFAKIFETRSWKTDYRGPIAIHASAKIPMEGRIICEHEPFKSALSFVGYTTAGDHLAWRGLPTGMILGTANLIECLPVANARQHDLLTDDELEFGDYSGGRWAWRLDGQKALALPVMAKGRLGLWEFNGTLG